MNATNYPYWRITVAQGCGVNYAYTCKQLERIAQRKLIENGHNICIIAPWWVRAAALVRKWRAM